MKRHFNLLMLLIVIVAGSLSSTPTAAANSVDVVPNEVVIWLYNATDLPAVASQYGLNATPINQFGANSIYRLQITNAKKPTELAKQLSTDSRVLFAEPNYINSLPEDGGKSIWSTGVPVGSYQTQWVSAMLRLDQAHTVTRGAGVKVAVLDTGIEATHELLLGHVAPGYDFVDRDDDPSEVGPASRAYGHGTHVAGLVAMVAPEATIIPYRVLDENGMGNMWVLAEAIYHAANPDGDPATDDGASVVNLSLGAGIRSKLLGEAIRYVTCEDIKNCPFPNRRGAVIVAAAGNEGANIRQFPAALPFTGVAAVAASTQNDTLASFSSFGKWVDLAAPGEGIVSSVPGGYATWSGTSMAAPLVAGEAALVRAVNPTMRARGVVRKMIQTALPLVNYKGFKRADVAAALGK